MYPPDGVYWLGMEGARAVTGLVSVRLVVSGGLLLQGPPVLLEGCGLLADG